MLYLSCPCPQIMLLCYLSSPYVTAVTHHEQHTHQETVKNVSGQTVEGAILQAVDFTWGQRSCPRGYSTQTSENAPGTGHRCLDHQLTMA